MEGVTGMMAWLGGSAMCRGGAGEAWRLRARATRTSTNRFFRIVGVAEMEAARKWNWKPRHSDLNAVAVARHEKR